MPPKGVGSTDPLSGTLKALAQRPIEACDVAGKRFGRRADGRWVDLAWDGKKETTKVEALSERYFALMRSDDKVARYLALGKHVLFVLGDVVYEIVPAKTR